MSMSPRPTPPLSLALLLGAPFRTLPIGMVQPWLSIGVMAVRWRHPAIFNRLDRFSGTSYVIDPIDLPFSFLLRPDRSSPSLRALRRNDDRISAATATIRGPFGALFLLLQGRSDGDALFFSRRIVIEGDTEAVLALRNALDDAEIDLLTDVISLAGPFGGGARRFLERIDRRVAGAAADLETIHIATLQPLASRVERLERTIAALKADSGGERPRRRPRGRASAEAIS